MEKDRAITLISKKVNNNAEKMVFYAYQIMKRLKPNSKPTLYLQKLKNILKEASKGDSKGAIQLIKNATAEILEEKDKTTTKLLSRIIEKTNLNSGTVQIICCFMTSKVLSKKLPDKNPLKEPEKLTNNTDNNKALPNDTDFLDQIGLVVDNMCGGFADNTLDTVQNNLVEHILLSDEEYDAFKLIIKNNYISELLHNFFPQEDNKAIINALDKNLNITPRSLIKKTLSNLSLSSIGSSLSQRSILAGRPDDTFYREQEATPKTSKGINPFSRRNSGASQSSGQSSQQPTYNCITQNRCIIS
ncbi:MAG: hypothetical protein ACJAQ0_000053 [Dasania sp.]|jgi:hypothetical protein